MINDNPNISSYIWWNFIVYDYIHNIMEQPLKTYKGYWACTKWKLSNKVKKLDCSETARRLFKEEEDCSKKLDIMIWCVLSGTMGDG